MGSKPDKQEALADLVLEVLDDMKAIDVVRLDVRHLTTLMDDMIVASGRSDRHVRAIAQALVVRCKEKGYPIASREGEEGGEWVLVDLMDVLVHIMLPKTREFYELEKLWDISVPAGNADRDRIRIR